MAAERYEAALQQYFMREASLILTPLHHVAAPCMAMGIPVVIFRRDRDERFSFLEELAPVYIPGDEARIDWRPPKIDISHVRENLIAWTRKKLDQITSGGSQLQ